ncbi:MAG: hypothetical protein Alis3KO_00790 [Aliiglaciecola sp.]
MKNFKKQCVALSIFVAVAVISSEVQATSGVKKPPVAAQAVEFSLLTWFKSFAF